MTSEARAWNEQRISNEVDDLTKYVTHDGKIYGMIHSEDVERLLRRVVSDEGRLCEQRVMALEAQLKESQRLHAECTTSLITADRQIERLKRERDESRWPAAEAQGVPDEVVEAIDTLCRVNEYHGSALVLRKWLQRRVVASEATGGVE